MEKDTSSSKFFIGALVGLVTGAAAAMFLSSKKGQEMTQNTKDMLMGFYDSVSQKAMDIKRMTETEYKDFMKQAAKEYVKMKDISGAAANEVFKEAQKSWDELSTTWQKK